MSTTRIAKWTIVSALCLAPLVAMASDEDHVVTQVINGMVYVSLGTRDGVAVGQRIEVLDETKTVVATLDLELCGEVICRAKLPPDVAGKVLRGMLVRVEQKAPSAGSSEPVPPPISTAPPIVPAPSASASASESAEPAPPPPPVPIKKKKPQHTVYTGLTLESVLTPYAPPAMGPAELPYRNGPAPAGYRLVDRPNTTLVKTGWWLFGISYGLGALLALGGDRGSSVMLIPALGPWIYAASDHSTNGYGSSSSSDKVAPAVACGLGQGIGILLLGIGYGGNNKKFVRDDVKVSVAPLITRDTWGLGIVGTL